MTFSQPTSYAFDPAYQSPAIVDASTNTYLSMRVKLVNPEASTMTVGVYCFSPTAAGYGSSSFSITQSASWQTVSFDLTNITGPYFGWSGDRYIRFDPADGAGNASLFDQATFDIDWIAVTDDASFDGSNPDADDLFTDFSVDRDFTFPQPSSKKGLQVQLIDDGIDLGNKWAGINVALSSLIDWDETEPLMVWTVDGVDIPINTTYLQSIDAQVHQYTAAGMLTVLILLNLPPSVDDGSPLIHPDTDLANMPNGIGAFNLTDADGYRHYRAGVELLARRYSEPTAIPGYAPWIIVGNEVNSHWWWYNIGETSIGNMCADYVKALRVTDLALRSAHQDMRTLMSLEHHWNVAYSTSTRSGKGRDVVSYVDQYADERGDFPWGIAYHPYPENLFDPEFWLDTSTSFTITTDRITPDNIEILPAIMRLPDYLYDGEMRDMMLTEQGFHGPDTTSGQDTQAAAYCYAYEKISQIDGIKSFILHRHVDHGGEGGLLLGLWTRDTSDPFPATPLNEKDIYYCFKYADTPSWATYFNPYLTNLPFSDWEDAAPVPTSINYHFEEDEEGWTADNQITSFGQSNGSLVGTSTGGDPFMRGESVWILGDTVDTLYISMRTSGGSTGQLYWTTTAEPYESEAKSKSFSLTSDGSYKLYTLDMSSHAYWAGDEITGLRFDPARTGSVDFAVDFIVDDWQVLLPLAPSGLSASGVSTSQINLTWTDSATNEAGYALERSPNGSTGWTEIADLNANTTSYNDTELSANTTYYYRVRAYSTDGYSGYSNTASGTTQSNAPNAPSGLSAAATSASTISLSWIDNASNETGFKIERSVDGVSFSQITTVGANVTSFGDSGLSSNTSYWYRVRAYNGSGDSSYAGPAVATTDGTPQYNINYTFASSAEGWSNTHDLTAFSVSGGVLSTTSTGSDPYMHGPTISVPGDLIDVIEVRMRVTAGSVGQLFWVNNEGGTAQVRSQTFAINADSAWHTYYIDLSSHAEWKGTTITMLRLDPTNTSGADIDIDYIRGAYVSQIDYTFDSSAEGWSNTHDLSSFSVSGGILSTSSTGSDPFMEGPNISVDGSGEDKIWVRMKVSAGSLGQLFWRNEDGSWSETRSQTFTVTPGTEYRVYQLDLSSHAHWAGKTIYQLRLDPTNTSSATIDIDYISGTAPTS